MAVLHPEIDRDKLVRMLLRAYADEWIAAYYYTLTAYAIKGPFSKEISEVFLKEAEEEINKHARAIADRLQDLDVDPPGDFKQLWELSGCKYPRVPDDPHDIDGWIKAAIEAERCAIKTYRELFDYTHAKDPVTEELAEELLRDETRHETELRNLLSKTAYKELGAKG